MNKPIFMGAAILDFSKMLKFRFHYDIVKAKYGDTTNLPFTDTDSLCYSIECEDVYKDLQGDLGKHFDFSAYPKDHPLYNTDNKKFRASLRMKRSMENSKPYLNFAVCDQRCMHIRSVVKINSRQRGLKNALLKRNWTSIFIRKYYVGRTITV